MKIISCLFYSISLFSLTVFSQSITKKPADSVQYLTSSCWDDVSNWNVTQQETSIKKSNFEGIENNGIALNYNISSSGGWFDVCTQVNSKWNRNTPLVFYIRTTPSGNESFEMKMIDYDGSIFRRVVPLRNYDGKWNHVVLFLNDTQHAWGGDSKFDSIKSFSFAVQGKGSGMIWLDQIGIGKPDLTSTFIPLLDTDSTLAGTGFAQRRSPFITHEDPMVLEYLKKIQDTYAPEINLLPSMEDAANELQTFNNSLIAIAFTIKDEKNRAERILDYFANALDTGNMDKLKQNFFCNHEARGFYQKIDTATHMADSTADRWIGDIAWLLIACKNYEQKFSSHRYDNLVKIIKDLLISFYKESDHGGYIQSGWRKGDSYLHEKTGHHEGNIDCYVAMKLCGEDYYASKIKDWIDDQLSNLGCLPLDLYTWRVLAFGSKYSQLLNIPEYNYGYRKVIIVNGKKTTGFYHGNDINVNNFWNDGTEHIACAFQAFGDKQRGYFYANQLDNLIIDRKIGNQTFHAIPYVLNKDGGCYDWVDLNKGFVSCAAWYIFAKNGYNPFMSWKFQK